MRTVVGLFDSRNEARRTIDRAKGVLMDRHGLNEQAAYDFIQKSAMSSRRQMRDVAQDVVDGELVPSSGT